MRRHLARIAAAATLVFLIGTPLAQAQTRRPSLREAASRVSFAQPPAERSDPNRNGAAIGALIGAGTMVAVLAIASSGCDAGCENDLPAGMPFFAGAIGAAGGAAVGYLIDKAHRGSPRKVAVVPAVTRRARGVRVAVRF